MFKPYGADALVFNVQELLLRQLHVQEVLEDQSVGEHRVLRGTQANIVTSLENKKRRKEKQSD